VTAHLLGAVAAVPDRDDSFALQASLLASVGGILVNQQWNA
jgi:hypothetical protein